ncbi:MAG: ATP-binding protein [Candidatus Njordarchaeales archaeon]
MVNSVENIIVQPPIGFVLSEATVIGIPIAFFSGEAEVLSREEELVIIKDDIHEKAPLILGVLRQIRRLEPFLRRYQRVSVIDFPEAIDKVEKLPYTNGVVIPLAEIVQENNNLVSISRNVTYVPFPGGKVYRIKQAGVLTYLLKNLLPQEVQPLVLGNHKYTEGLEIPLDPRYIKYHIGIFGATGMGKSRLVKALVDEILEKTNYSVIIFDHTGMDYTTFYPDSTLDSFKIKLDPLAFADWLKAKLRAPPTLASYLEAAAPEALENILQQDFENRTKQLTLDTLMGTTEQLRKEEIVYEAFLEELTSVIKSLGARPQTVRSLEIRYRLLVRSEELFRMIFREYDPEDVIDMAYKYKSEKKPLVIDLSLEETLEAKRAIIAGIIEEIWRRITNERRPVNIVVVVDEAQNYAWRAGICEELLTRIAREGRKWGFGLIVASQRLAGSVNTDIRGNINTIFFSKLSQTGDLAEIQQFADITGIDQSNLAQLMPREFYVAGLMNPLRKPIAIRVREVLLPGEKVG